MQIYRIDHVAQAVPDLEPQVALLEKLFGFRLTHRWDNPAAGVRGARLEVPGRHVWQVLAPTGAGTDPDAGWTSTAAAPACTTSASRSLTWTRRCPNWTNAASR